MNKTIFTIILIAMQLTFIQLRASYFSSCLDRSIKGPKNIRIQVIKACRTINTRSKWECLDTAAGTWLAKTDIIYACSNTHYDSDYQINCLNKSIKGPSSHRAEIIRGCNHINTFNEWECVSYSSGNYLADIDIIEACIN